MSADLETKALRTVFFGTPDLALPALQTLADRTTVVACVTQPDKPVGRKQLLTPPPVKVLAESLGIPVHQPPTLKLEKEAGKEFFDTFTSWKPDLALVFAYGKILPSAYLASCPLGFLNIHPSLLPAFRGPTPIQAAIRACQRETGVSIMQLDSGMDTGPILAQVSEPILPTDTSASLGARLSQLGAELFSKVLPAYQSGSLTPQPQPESGVSLTELLTKESGRIDWSQTPQQLDCHIRAMSPWPMAFTEMDGKRIKITRAHLDSTGQLAVDEVIPEGRSAMPYSQFERSNPGLKLPPVASA